jgi:hypothetical protein
MDRQSNIRRFYGDLFEEHHLSPADIERFVRLVDRQQDERAAVLKTVPFRDQQRWVPRVVSSRHEHHSEMRELLGPAAFAMYQTYTHHIVSRLRVNAFRDRLARTSQPLRPEQRSKLLQILSEEDEQKYRRTAATVPRVVGLHIPDVRARLESERLCERRVRERAAGLFTPVQLRRFMRWRRMEFARIRFNLWLEKLSGRRS